MTATLKASLATFLIRKRIRTFVQLEGKKKQWLNFPSANEATF